MAKIVFKHPESLKENIFHYCPGCGHSIVHRLIAEVIDEMGIRGIIRNGRAVAFLVSRSVMESILETMELQKNSRLMAQIRAHKAGKLKFTPLGHEEG